MGELIRLPFLRYIVYLCIIDDFNTKQIKVDLELLHLSAPGLDNYVKYYKEYLFHPDARRIPHLSLELPAGKFHKYNIQKKHDAIEKKLRSLGLSELYHEDTYYLRYILLHPRIREIIHELGLKRINIEIVLSILKEWGNIIIPRKQLELYYKYFWDFAHMSIDDWYSYLETINDYEVRDRYVDILSNDAAYILGEYDYTDGIETDRIADFALRQIYLRFRKLSESEGNDELLLKYGDLIRKYAADLTDQKTKSSDEVQSLIALFSDAQIGYKDVEEVFSQKEGSGTPEQKGKQGLDEGLLDLRQEKLPDE